MQKILNHLGKNYKFAPFVAAAQLEEIIPQTPDAYFERLTRSIAYQQLSGKAAGTIYGRFKQLFPDEMVTVEAVVTTPHEKMREVGLSNSKASYIRNIAEAVLEGKVNFERYPELDEEEIITELTQIKGVGRWTVEMFLMFTMGRPDIFSYGDLGLAKGFEKIFGFSIKSDRQAADKIIKSWSPYRTYASLVLWDAADTKN